MTWLKRIGFMLVTNLLIMLMIGFIFSILTSVFGVRISQGYLGLFIFCALMGFGGSLISLMLSKWMAKKMMGVQIIDPAQASPQMRELIEIVHGLARKAGLQTMPEVGVYDSPDINAFATGPSRNNSLVAVSTGLLRIMSRDEIEGVLGHEITHVANGDMVTMTLILGIVNTFVFFLARVVASIIMSSGNDRDRRGGNSFMYFIVVQLLDVCFGLLASIAVSYFSRLREYRADAGGARLAGREKMIAGLRKLQSQFQSLQPDQTAAATLKISSRDGGWLKLVSSHPPLEERIHRLEEMRNVL